MQEFISPPPDIMSEWSWFPQGGEDYQTGSGRRGRAGCQLHEV